MIEQWPPAGAEPLASFVVLGEAKGAGSKKAFRNPHTDRIIVTDDVGRAGKLWRLDVKAAAVSHFSEPVGGPLAVEIVFQRARPRGHYGTGRNEGVVKSGAPTLPTTRPDVDKLSRAILDALTGIAWRDDAQVVTKLVEKRYGLADRTHVRIFALSESYHSGHERDEAEQQALAV